jgi:WD repeat-containing protein 45
VSVGPTEIPKGSLRFVVPLHRTNILFLVGGPPAPRFPPNKVVVWDARARKAVCELAFSQDVRGLAVRSDRLAVALRTRLLLFALGRGQDGIWREGAYETVDNPKGKWRCGLDRSVDMLAQRRRIPHTGLVAIGTDPGSTLLVFPGRQVGHVQIVRLPPLDPTVSPQPRSARHNPTLPPFPTVSILVAHTSPLAAISSTPSGSLLATASARGTLIRIWDPSTSRLSRELRRGSDPADIFDVRLRPDGGAVCVSSDKGTIHVWRLTDPPPWNRPPPEEYASRTRLSVYLRNQS